VENIGQSILGTPKDSRTKDVKDKLPRNPRSQKETDQIAEWLVQKFKSPKHRPFFLKVAWRLPRGLIEKHAATALELGKNPRAYFISLVKGEKDYYEEKTTKKVK
jgi:hypothetical protein